MIGVGLAWLFLPCLRPGSAGASASAFPMRLPSAALRQSTRNDNAPAPDTALVRYTWPLTMMGEDQPSPGTATFHATFFVSLHSTGSPRAGANTLAGGPAHHP